MSRRALLWAVPLTLAAALRFGAAWKMRDVFPSSPDEGYYEASVALQEVHPNSRPGLYAGMVWPSLLAAADAPFARTSPAHARFAAAAVGTLSAAAAFSLAEALVSPWAGFIAALGVALDPRLLDASAGLNVHTFYGLTLLVCAAAAAAWARAPAAGLAAAGLGAAVGASLACRFAHFPLPAFLLAAAWRWLGPARGARAWLWAMAWAALFLGPVMARNGLLFGRPLAFDSAKGSYHLLKGAVSPDTQAPAAQSLELARLLDPSFPSHSTVQEQELAMVALAKKQALEHPWRYLGYCLRRQLSFWGNMPLLAAAAAAGVWLGGRALAAAALPLAALCGYAVGGGQPEHAVGALPLLWALAGAAAVLEARRRGLKLPEAAAGRPWGLRAAAAVFALAYASSVYYAALEVRAFAWNDPPPAPSRDRAIDMHFQGSFQKGKEDAYVSILLGLAFEAQNAGKAAEEGALLERARGLAPSDPLVQAAWEDWRRRKKDPSAEPAWRAQLRRRP
jgi:hypothetical protein